MTVPAAGIQPAFEKAMFICGVSNCIHARYSSREPQEERLPVVAVERQRGVFAEALTSGESAQLRMRVAGDAGLNTRADVYFGGSDEN